MEMILKHYFIFCQARKTFQRPRIFSVTVKKSSSMKWIQLSGEDSITGHPGGVDQSHLQMFTKAYTKLSNTQWKNGPKTTNPVESINRQSVNEKGSSLYALLENIYTEDRAHAARLAAMQSNVTMSYSNPDEALTRRNKKGSPKRKRSSMLVSDVHDEGNWMHHQAKESTLTAMV